MCSGAELGEGTYSKVKHCTWQKAGESTSKHIAIKGCLIISLSYLTTFLVINKKTAPKDFLDKFLPRELEIIRSVSFAPFFIRFHTVFLPKK